MTTLDQSIFGGTYKTGTVTINNGDTALVGSGSLWQTIQISIGDIFLSNGFFSYVDSVTDETHLTLGDPWAGPDLAADTYTILKTSWLRYEPSLTQAKVRDLIARYTGLGVIIGVEGTTPDPELGKDGDFALKVNSGAWNLWEMVGGVWVDRGTPAGISSEGIWDSATPYAVNDVVSRLGVLYIAKRSSTNKAPETYSSLSDPDRYWEVLLQGGNLYDILLDASDRPESGDRFRKVVFGRPVMIPAGMSDSTAQADTAATADTTFTLRKSHDHGVTWTNFATCTFLAGSHVGTYTCASDVSFVRDDCLEILAPDPRDATLADISFTISAFR